jgi:hypothetical protein
MTDSGPLRLSHGPDPRSINKNSGSDLEWDSLRARQARLWKVSRLAILAVIHAPLVRSRSVPVSAIRNAKRPYTGALKIAIEFTA